MRLLLAGIPCAAPVPQLGDADSIPECDTLRVISWGCVLMHFSHSGGPLHFSTHVLQCSTVRVRAYYAGCRCLQLAMLPAAFLGILSNLNIRRYT